MLLSDLWRIPARSLRLLLGAAGVACLFALLDATVLNIANPWERPSNAFSYSFPRLIVPWLLLGVMGAGAVSLARRFPITKDMLVKSASVHIAAALSFPIIHLFAVAMSHELVYDVPDDLWINYRSMLPNYTGQDVLAYVGVVTLVHAASYWSAARAGERTAVELQAALTETRLAVLTAQLRPHFLFNTLNTVVMLVREGEKSRAVDVLTNLSDVLRSALEATNDSEVRLVEELQLVEKYLSIEQERYHDRLTVKVAATAEAECALVPRFILQPFVENAIRHGLTEKKSGGRIEVDAIRASERLILEVRDNGVGLEAMKRSTRGHGIGLRNTTERLHRLYGGAAQCTLRAGNPGATVRIVLPYRVGPERSNAR